MFDIAVAQFGMYQETSAPQSLRYTNSASCHQRPIIGLGVKKVEELKSKKGSKRETCGKSYRQKVKGVCGGFGYSEAVLARW